jgi:hypothetical protein
MRTGTTTHLSAAEASKALATADPGSTLVYATGDVATDAVPLDAAELRQMRGMIWDAMRAGKVALTQRLIA